MHHLPAISQKEMPVLIEAIYCFTETGELWNAQTWSHKLNKKLALCHGQDPSGVCQRITRNALRIHKSTFRLCKHPAHHLSIFPPLSRLSTSLTMIHPLITSQKTRVGRQQTLPTMNQRALCFQLLPLTMDFAIFLPSTRLYINPDRFALDDVQSSVQVLLDHALPLMKHRTNVVTEQYIPRGRLFGGYATRGQGITTPQVS